MFAIAAFGPLTAAHPPNISLQSTHQTHRHVNIDHPIAKVPTQILTVCRSHRAFYSLAALTNSNHGQQDRRPPDAPPGHRHHEPAEEGRAAHRGWPRAVPLLGRRRAHHRGKFLSSCSLPCLSLTSFPSFHSTPSSTRRSRSSATPTATRASSSASRSSSRRASARPRRRSTSTAARRSATRASR